MWTQLETRQNGFILSAVVFTPPTRTRQNWLVLSSWRCEHNCRQDKTVLSRPCRLCEQAISCKLETGSRRDKTVLSAVWTQLETRHKTVLSRPRRRCEQAITCYRLMVPDYTTGSLITGTASRVGIWYFVLTNFCYRHTKLFNSAAASTKEAEISKRNSTKLCQTVDSKLR